MGMKGEPRGMRGSRKYHKRPSATGSCFQLPGSLLIPAFRDTIGDPARFPTNPPDEAVGSA